jgi:hypothetical protein
MNVFHSLSRYFHLASFWRERPVFYRDLAQGLQDRELLRDFLVGELEISTAPTTRDVHRARGLKQMLMLMEDGVTNIDEVLRATMPAADSMALATLAFSSDSEDKQNCLRELANGIDRQKEMVKTIKKALTPPAVLLPIGFSFAYMLTSFSIPAFEKAAPPEVWVGFSEVVRTAAHLFTFWGPVLAIGTVVLVAWMAFWGLQNLTAGWRYRCERSVGWARLGWLLTGPVAPMLTLYRDIQSARMLANLATLLLAGRGLQDAVSDLSDSASPWMRRHLSWILDHLQMMPGDYVGAFSHGVLAPSMLARLHTQVRRDVGNDFSSILVEMGTSGQQKAAEAVDTYAARMNALVLSGIFGLILFFYLGQSWITYQIQDANSPAKVQMRLLQKSAKTSQ